MAKSLLRCSFCGKDQNEVFRLVAGPGVYICGDCVEVSMQILSASGPQPGFRVLTQAADGTVQRCDLGPVPEDLKVRWLRQCKGCGAWNAGTAVTTCLACGTGLG
jgi:hypothetical protein